LTAICRRAIEQWGLQIKDLRRKATMPVRLVRSSADFAERFAQFLAMKREVSADIESATRTIVEDVAVRGDLALIEATRKFDRLDIDPGRLRIAAAEIDDAVKACDAKTLDALKFARDRIEVFHRRQLPGDDRFTDALGVELGWRWNAIESVGLYVPGGTAAYPSSVLMNAVPAKVAGVARVVMVVPSPDGKLNPLVLAAAQLGGVSEIYRVGGAQAVAALAYGTDTIAPVAKIVGPGNAYVAAAKRLVFGKVGIDMIAGPSEVLVIADDTGNAGWIAADLLAQAEYDASARSILITDSAALAADVARAVASNSNLLVLIHRLRAVHVYRDGFILVHGLSAIALYVYGLVAVDGLCPVAPHPVRLVVLHFDVLVFFGVDEHLLAALLVLEPDLVEAAAARLPDVEAAAVIVIDVEAATEHLPAEFRHRADECDIALVEQCDAVAHALHPFEQMGRQQHGHALVLEVADDVEQFRRRLRVETGGGLVEDEQLRSMHERQQQADLLTVPLRQLVDRAIEADVEPLDQRGRLAWLGDRCRRSGERIGSQRVRPPLVEGSKDGVAWDGSRRRRFGRGSFDAHSRQRTRIRRKQEKAGTLAGCGQHHDDGRREERHREPKPSPEQDDRGAQDIRHRARLSSPLEAASER
jgi:histidinol dehydrogenase